MPISYQDYEININKHCQSSGFVFYVPGNSLSHTETLPQFKIGEACLKLMTLA